MSLGTTIAPHIPYLRRFARALTGSQASGDAYVGAVLEALLADPASFREDLDPRVALYKVFCTMWQPLAGALGPESAISPWERTADRRLEMLTPVARQAFLLVTVEEFSLSQAAEILGISEAQAASLIDEAGREIAEQVSTAVLIIEDEPIIAMDLEHIVRSLGHEVMGIARTHAEALKAVQVRRPGLVLADIHLADGSSGIDAVNEMLSRFEAPVIFVTAFPERLLTGDRPEPAFLITKPFYPDMIKAVISQALFFNMNAGPPKSRVLS